MKKLFIIITFFLFTIFCFGNKLEYKYNIYGSKYILTDNSDDKTENYIFNPFWGYINKDLQKILNAYPESLKKLKTAKNLHITSSIFLGIHFGSLIGPIICFPISLVIYNDTYGNLNGYTPTDGLSIMGFVLSGISIIGLILTIIFEASHPRFVKKSFELYNKINNKKLSFLLNYKNNVELGLNYKF